MPFHKLLLKFNLTLISDRVRPNRPPRAVLVIVGCLLGLAFMSLPSAADLTDDINELREKREELNEQQEEKAADIELATAEAEELREALAVWNRRLNRTEAAFEGAKQRLAEAERLLRRANNRVEASERAIVKLERELVERAVNAFVGRQPTNQIIFNEGHKPGESIRIKTLLTKVTDQDFDVAEKLRAKREELALRRAVAEESKLEADQRQIELEEQLAEVEYARNKQAEVAAAAEARLEARLYEQQLLIEQGLQLQFELDQKTKELQEQLMSSPVSPNPGSSVAYGNYPTADQLRKVGVFWVHEDVAANLAAMLAQAEAEGYNFAGWGYRDHKTQIALRKKHCGSSEWEIWHKPSSQCSPPTARPGRSMHEYGKAIDFTYNGGSIGTRYNPGFKWLSANAARYGFYNLPSEPWHWSTNGN